MPDQRLAIGIFDSGVGGLTVLRRIVERLPHEDLVYLGDTARIPYGTKSPETVIRYASACAGVLLERPLKLMVVACNTASAHALSALRDRVDVPVIGVIEPGAKAAVAATRNKRIGVIGTPGTIASGSYQDAIHRIAGDAAVFAKPCPLFVPLAEEGWTEGDVPTRVAQSYLAELKDQAVDTLVLGCTHYPLLAGVCRNVMGPGVAIVDSAESTAAEIEIVLRAMDALAADNGTPSRVYLTSDSPESFARVGRRFLGDAIPSVDWVDF